MHSPILKRSMSTKCKVLMRFTHAGQKYDRWYCQGCCAVMFLPHGDPPPDEHDKGENILPKDIEVTPLPPIQALIGTGSSHVATPRDVQTMSVKTALETYTESLPSDMSVVTKGK